MTKNENILQNLPVFCDGFRKRGSMEPQIDQEDRNVGRRYAADAGSLPDGGGAELGKLLRRLDAESCYLPIVKGAWQLS